MRVSLLVGAFLAAAAQPGAAGPWPRGEEKTFLAFSYEASVDLEDPYLVSGHEVLLYGEYGLGRPETAGAGATPQQRFLRSRANSIEGGTTEVMQNILGERVLGLPGDVRVDRDVPWSDVPRN